MARAKLHSPSPADNSKPACGRQLIRQGSNPEASKYVQGTSSMLLTANDGLVTCKHCLRAIGLLAPLQRSTPSDDEVEDMEDGSDE